MSTHNNDTLSRENAELSREVQIISDSGEPEGKNTAQYATTLALLSIPVIWLPLLFALLVFVRSS